MPFLNRLVTRDVSTIRPGHVGYCVWCDEEGQVIDDGTLFHLEQGVYWLCSQERQLDWLRASALGFDVSIAEETDEFAALALQGPTSCSGAQEPRPCGHRAAAPVRAAPRSTSKAAQLMVSRTGFTGDLGYELWIEPRHAEALWDRLFEAGRIHGLKPMGTLALDMSRIEAGYIQAGVDYVPADQAVRPGRTRSPFELDARVARGFQPSRISLAAARCSPRSERGSRYRLVKLDIEGNKPAKDAFIYDSAPEAWWAR